MNKKTKNTDKATMGQLNNLFDPKQPCCVCGRKIGDKLYRNADKWYHWECIDAENKRKANTSNSKFFWYKGGNHFALVEDGKRTMLQVLRERESDVITSEMHEVEIAVNKYEVLCSVAEAAENLVSKAYCREGKHEDFHIHPALVVELSYALATLRKVGGK